MSYKKIIVVIFASVHSLIGMAQKNLQQQGSKILGNSIYLIRDGSDIRYFTDKNKKDDAIDIHEKTIFSLKGNAMNIYFEWLNPIHYKLDWKDSVKTNETDKLINDFIKDYVSRIVPTLSVTNKEANNDLLVKADAGNLKAKNLTPISIPADGFHSSKLTTLYITLRTNQNSFTEDERLAINRLTPLFESLDTKNAIDMEKQASEIFTNLYPLEMPDIAIEDVKQFKGEVAANKEILKDVESEQKAILSMAAGMAIADPLFKRLIVGSVQDFNKETSDALKVKREAIVKLENLFSVFDKSFKNLSELSGFYRVKKLDFTDDQQFETLLTLSEYEIKMETKEIVKKLEITSPKLIFKKYDFISVTVGAGVFYGSATMSAFGISPSNTEFTVTQEDIEKNTAITALFANLNFGLGSRYFAPMIQLGIDPTKKQPYFLLGGGFSIPAARFAISAGGIWTWDQQLNKLSIGQKVSSSTELDKDIKSKFLVDPRGWYLGVQYNF